jgi:hypothetical protein
MIFSAELIAALRNNLRRFTEPMDLMVSVVHNGQRVETIRLAQLPELPEGTTEQRSQYAPPGGFTSGLWEFHFELVTKRFRVAATNTPSFDGNALVSSRNFQIVGSVLVLASAGTWFFVIGRRRRRAKEDATEVVDS